jgi:membrane protein DedA with SNARE-associated domain
VWATAGYLAGDHIRAIVADLHRFQWHLLAAAVVLALAYAGWRLTRRLGRPG